MDNIHHGSPQSDSAFKRVRHKLLSGPERHRKGDSLHKNNCIHVYQKYINDKWAFVFILHYIYFVN